ncbi:Required for respiratory growth protein 9 mitochondrial [Pleurotus pulmonarius]|nr:Required for respiratory growth protein 9 mitochondrial [Pleurotus pulmonarius]
MHRAATSLQHSLYRPLFSAHTFACLRSSIHRLYSSSVLPSSSQKWRIAGMPTPRSILDDDDTPVDLTEDSDAVNGVRPNQPPLHRRKPPREPTPAQYQAHREVMKEKFPDGWEPPRKLSREAMEGLRDLHRFSPETFTTSVLADKFKISSEAVRRILKSKWQPPKAKIARLAMRERGIREQFIRERKEKEAAQSQELQSLKQGYVSGREGGRRVIGAHAKDMLEFD